MSTYDFLNQLGRRAALVDLDVSFALAAQLERYYRLLSHWNATINLTALRLEPVTDQAIDRLLIEPLRAARYLSAESPAWYDVGSGGGSPAIPLKLALPSAQLTMVESKERKAAFLREAIRVLHLDQATVEVARLETVADEPTLAESADLITVRAVRIDPSLFGAVLTLLRTEGQLLLFGARRAELTLPRGLALSDQDDGSGEIASDIVVLHRTRG
jgi:16S rRNA (guanine527-N7)-methyltransferase